MGSNSILSGPILMLTNIENCQRKNANQFVTDNRKYFVLIYILLPWFARSSFLDSFHQSKFVEQNELI